MNESANALIRQNRLFIAVVTLLFFITISFYYMGVETPKQNEIPIDKKIDLPIDKILPQEIWIEKVEKSHKIMEQKFNYLESVILEGKKQEIELRNEKQALLNDVDNLRKELKSLSDGKITKTSGQRDPFEYNSNSEPPNFQETIVVRQPLREVVMPISRDKIHHVDEMIPAGTTVKAVLVSSLDAVCGVYATANPIPVKLRILDNAHLPKQVNVKLKGGIIIGTAYGNISSERVFMRAERLTQVKSNGDFIETEVAAYISGEDGKYGVRGVVVDKSSKAVFNAAASGFLSGVSNALQSAVSRRNYDSNNSYNIGIDLASQGGAQGSQTGLDLLADYYIKRAEQIQPVIQVNAGRIVDVTFTLGVPTGAIHTKDTIRKIRQNNR